MADLPRAEASYEPLPAAWGRDEVRVLPKDPSRALVLWELTPEGVGRAREALGAGAPGSQLVLRHTGTGSGRRDVALTDWLGRAHLSGLEPGTRLLAVVGFLTEDGTFAAVARTGPVQLPRDGPGTGEVRGVRSAAPEAPGPDVAAAEVPGPDVVAAEVPAPLRERTEPVATPFDPATTSSS